MEKATRLAPRWLFRGQRNYLLVLLESEELDGVLLVEPAPAPLALSFLFRSIVVDEELEPDGAAVVPLADEDDEPDGVALVAPEGDVVDDELEERSAAPRSHAVISVAPSARETTTAIVESLMWPPWLGYIYEAARIGPSAERQCFRPCTGVDVAEDPAAAGGTIDDLSVFGDGGVVVLRSQAVNESTTAMASAMVFMAVRLLSPRSLQGRGPFPARVPCAP